MLLVKYLNFFHDFNFLACYYSKARATTMKTQFRSPERSGSSEYLFGLSSIVAHFTFSLFSCLFSLVILWPLDSACVCLFLLCLRASACVRCYHFRLFPSVSAVSVYNHFFSASFRLCLLVLACFKAGVRTPLVIPYHSHFLEQVRASDAPVVQPRDPGEALGRLSNCLVTVPCTRYLFHNSSTIVTLS